MNKKKLMALLLAGVMAATTVSVPVFAEDGGNFRYTFSSWKYRLFRKIQPVLC